MLSYCDSYLDGGPGAAMPISSFKHVDFHVHSPVSACYEDNMRPEANLHTQPEEIVEAATRAGLDAIAITDHNSGKGLDAIREAAARRGLVVFPGTEITTRGGHLLAIFEQDTSAALITGLVRALGFDEAKEGQGYEETRVWLDEVARMVTERGGLAIAAHIDRQPRGFTASFESLTDKKRIHSSPYLAALEITNPSNKGAWTQGTMPHYAKQYPCLQDSDAHAPGEVGRRSTYLKVPHLTLEGLRLAFREFEARVRFPQELDRPA